ncbi:MAG: SMC-Scp complex subunit ScpB [Candidatus Altiarchaeota archaeon]|nr:SMC-Scp complex subunit ScpB [Candidatus Altiarchaeota archaeon]
MSVKATVEAALFVSGTNLSVEKIAKVLGLEDLKSVKEAAEELVKEYRQRDGGVEVYKSGKTYGMRVKTELEDHVTALIPETEMPKAMLKTLALIAYEQPIKQSYVVKIRGNRVYEYFKRLEDSGFIERKDDGHTKIISTTDKFNKYFKINDAKELVKKEDIEEDNNQTTLEGPQVEEQ